MDGRLTRTNCDEAGDYVVPDVLSPRDLVSRPDNMDETVLSSSTRGNINVDAISILRGTRNLSLVLIRFRLFDEKRKTMT